MSMLQSKGSIADHVTTLFTESLLSHQDPLLRHYGSPLMAKGGLVGEEGVSNLSVEVHSVYSTTPVDKADFIHNKFDLVHFSVRSISSCFHRNFPVCLVLLAAFAYYVIECLSFFLSLSLSLPLHIAYTCYFSESFFKF